MLVLVLKNQEEAMVKTKTNEISYIENMDEFLDMEAKIACQNGFKNEMVII